jgi:predicted nucleic acid-binding protein
VNPSALAAPIETSHETVDELIARVLSRAHRKMEALNAPNEARAVLDVAHSFADELATLDPRFDRLQFIKGVTEDPS